MSGKRAASHIFKVPFCHTRKGRHTSGFPGATCSSPLLPHQSCCQHTWHAHGLCPPSPNPELTTTCVQGCCTSSRDGATGRDTRGHYYLQGKMWFCLPKWFCPAWHRGIIRVDSLTSHLHLTAHSILHKGRTGTFLLGTTARGSLTARGTGSLTASETTQHSPFYARS